MLNYIGNFRDMFSQTLPQAPSKENVKKKLVP